MIHTLEKRKPFMKKLPLPIERLFGPNQIIIPPIIFPVQPKALRVWEEAGPSPLQ